MGLDGWTATYSKVTFSHQITLLLYVWNNQTPAPMRHTSTYMMSLFLRAHPSLSVFKMPQRAQLKTLPGDLTKMKLPWPRHKNGYPIDHAMGNQACHTSTSRIFPNTITCSSSHNLEGMRWARLVRRFQHSRQ